MPTLVHYFFCFAYIDNCFLRRTLCWFRLVSIATVVVLENLLMYRVNDGSLKLYAATIRANLAKQTREAKTEHDRNEGDSKGGV